jgi:hypothetical protein
MNSTKLNESSVFSEVRASTSSQTTASEGSPGAAFSAATAASESAVSMCSTAIEPSRGMSSSFRSPRIRLASSRATSQRITSPAGFVAAPCRCTMLRTAGEALRTSSAWCAMSSGATILRWIMRRTRPSRP